jgi:NitT/TauT family transport system permease protein
MGTNTSSGKRSPVLLVISLTAAIAFWQIIADYVVKNKFILPSCSDTLAAFFQLYASGAIWTDIWTSLMHFAIGLLLALVVGVPIGICIGWFDRVNQLLDPLIEIIRPIPPLAWIPFAIVWFGLTDFSAGFVIFIGSVFPIIINTYEGFRSVPRVFVEAGRMLGCNSSFSLIRYIAFPAALPHLAAGFRIASGVAWMCLVAAEMFGVSRFGLGQKIWWYYNLHQMDSVLVYMLLLGFSGLFIDYLFRYGVEHSLLRWRVGEVN